jgi:hypothetical protein
MQGDHLDRLPGYVISLTFNNGTSQCERRVHKQSWNLNIHPLGSTEEKHREIHREQSAITFESLTQCDVVL